MTADFLPLRLLLLTFAGWVNRHQQHVIDYLMEENRVLREQLRGRRVRWTDDQRGCLAAKGQRLGRQVLRQVATIVTPDTILRWYRRLIAQKWTSECRRPGRPGLMKEIASLIMRMATENPACLSGTVRTLDSRGVPGPPDPVRRTAATARTQGVRGALPRGAESSGPRQRLDCAGSPRDRQRPSSLPRTLGRPVALLLPGGVSVGRGFRTVRGDAGRRVAQRRGGD